MFPASIVRRTRARRRLRDELAVFYHSAYAPRSLSTTVRVPGFELLRGELVISDLAAKGLLEPGDVRASPLATIEELSRFHSMEYIEATEEAETLARIFGIDPSIVDVEELLAMQKRAVGATIAAAKMVTRYERSTAVNLGGGFHHAEPDRGSGFCVYNDVGVAIKTLQSQGFDKAIAVIDLDFHQGNGTLLGLSADPSVLYFGIEGAVWSKERVPHARTIELPSGTGDDAYFAALSEALPNALAEHKPHLVFYVAGTDVLAGDRLGTFSLSHRGVLARDRHVYEVVHGLGASLVVTLGGGYGPDAWRATARFLRYMLTADTRIEKKPAPSARSHFARITQMPQDDLFELNAADIDENLGRSAPTRRILDQFGVHGMETAFERYGVAAKLRARGWRDLEVTIDPSDRSHQLIRLHGRKESDGPRFLLIEVVVAKTTLPTPAGIEPNDPLRLLLVEWLLLQDPSSPFTGGRPRLPGQQHPGLGVTAEMQALFIHASQRLQLDGVLNRPAHYHTGLFGSDSFFFLDPRVEGRMLAIIAVLKDLPIAEASALVEKKALRLVDGTAVPWDPSDFVLPTSDRLANYFASDHYKNAVEEARENVLAAGLSVHETSF
jgi:acetoin utilization deacetylase AcuC-like enzyme